MILLVDAEDFKPYRHISDNVDFIRRVEIYIREAQRFDIRDALGAKLFFDLIKDYDDSPPSENYVDLVEGTTYIKDEVTIDYAGLKPAICLYAYARFLKADNLRSTPSGFVQKKNEFSEQPDPKTVAMAITNAQDTAKEYLREVLEYLNNNKDLYPMWNGNYCVPSPVGTGGIRISAVGGSDFESDSDYENPRVL